MEQPEVKKMEKRNRPPVSCEPCRGRKLKCDRGLPCDACTRRRKQCHYASNARPSKGKARSPTKGRDFKDRLNSLEQVVSAFISGEAVARPARGPSDTPSSTSPGGQGGGSTLNPYPTPGSRSDGEALTPETPRLQEMGDGQVNYIDPSHWQSILEDIMEVKEHLSQPDASLSSPQDTEAGMQNVEGDASFLFDEDAKVGGLVEIVDSLPPRPICDMLLSKYFTTRFLLPPIIHPTKFQKEYDAFWDAPMEAPPLWTGLLFSILGLTASMRKLYNPEDDPPGGLIPPPAMLQQRAVQCLVLGRYATANEHALEALTIHLLGCMFSRGTPLVNQWFEMGTVIRLAFRMGYYRDPASLPGVSAFDGEMRRRVWLHIVQVEALMSFQVGFPSMIPSEFCDTQLPRNLEFSDFDADTTVMPPGRPLSEHTPVCYVIAKSAVMAAFKNAVAHSQSLAVTSPEKADALDAELRRAYAGLPAAFRPRDVGRSFMDPTGLILERCTLEILHNKGIIVLHRRYVSYDAQSHRFETSRRACVEAALDILARMADVYTACQPGGRLFEERWMIFSLPAHDFLLAAMVVCLDLSVRMRSGVITSAELQDSRLLTGREFESLQAAKRTWAANALTSAETQVAALALGLMIDKVAESEASFLSTGVAVATVATAAPIQHAAPTSFLERPCGSSEDMELPYAGPMSHMLDGSETVDWGLLDHYFQNTEGFNTEFTL